MAFKVGASVRPVSIKGKVVEVKEPAAEGEARLYLVEWTDQKDGETHHRWFAEADLEAAGK